MVAQLCVLAMRMGQLRVVLTFKTAVPTRASLFLGGVAIAAGGRGSHPFVTATNLNLE